MSLFSLFTKDISSTALSFDNGYLRYVTVTKKDGMVDIADYGSEWLGPDIINADDAIIDDQRFVEKLRQLVRLKKNKKQFDQVVVVVPDHQAIMFHTHVVKEPVREMNDVIIDHIKTYCQAHELLSFADYICEYDVILETKFGYDIHVTLVPRTTLDHLVHLCNQAGIQVLHIETAHHAVSRACLDIPMGSAYIAVFIGEATTVVSLVHEDHLVSHERVAVGVEKLGATIEKFLNTDHEFAKRVLEKHGVLRTHPDIGLLGELYVALEPVWRSINRQIITHAERPYKLFGHRFSIERIVVYGSGVWVQGLPVFLEDKTDIPCRVLDVWQGHRPDRADMVQLPAHEMGIYAEPLSLALLYLG